MQCDAALEAGRAKRAERERVAAAAVHEVEELGAQVAQVVEPAAVPSAEPIGRCAAAIGRAAIEAVRHETAAVRAQLAREAEAIAAEASRLGSRCMAALGTLLRAHDLPGAEETLLLRLTGAIYEARLEQRAPWGVEAVLELEVPATSIFAHDLRIDHLAEGLEVHAPEPAGWIKKEIKMVPHKLGRYHVTELVVGAKEIVVRVRLAPEPGAPGFDVTVSGARVCVERAGAGADSGPPFDTDGRDLAPLSAFADKLATAARALRTGRKGLQAATIDGRALAEHPHPRTIAERLVEVMAPVVQEISARSLTPTELVLKRLLAGDRREEIFVSKAELTAKLEPLAGRERRVFQPLGLIDDDEDAETNVDPHAVLAPPRLPGMPPDTSAAEPPTSPHLPAAPPIQPMPAPPGPPPPPTVAGRLVRRTMPPPPPAPSAPPAPPPKPQAMVAPPTVPVGPPPTPRASAADVDAALRDLENDADDDK